MPVADTYAHATNPDANYGSSIALRTDASPDIRSYLRFDTQAVSGSITGATLRIYANSASSVGYSVRGVADNTWTEVGLTYNNAPPVGSIVNSSGAISANTWTTVDVTSLVSAGGLVSLALTAVNDTAISYSSREGANPPELVINVSSTQTLQGMAVELQPAAQIQMLAPAATATEPPPTAAPTSTLASSATPISEGSLQVVESDDPSVLRQGDWTAHDTEAASGGRYIYSSGSLEDTLTVFFQGTQADVIYVKHPSLGIFGIEIDGVLWQAVDSVAPDSVFGARATVNGLSDGQHVLRVYPLAGTIAIDAFAFETPLVLSPTSTPVVTPTQTAAPTTSATEPPPTATPTSTPLPALLPFMETFDSGWGWSATGSWMFDTQTAYKGAGWYADSTQRGAVSTLSSDLLIDLQGTVNPHLSFWQKAALSPVDVFAVEISADDGASWVALSQLIGPVNDWALFTLDLTPYTGDIIRLRYRLDTTSALPDGATTVGVWIDELSILDLPPTPTATPTAAPTSIPTPTTMPTDTPTSLPTPTATPTGIPTPTTMPTDTPTSLPTPTDLPS